MNIFLTRFSSGAVILAIIAVGIFSPIHKTEAATIGSAFGGLATFTLPCTCSGNLAIWFAPLWLGNVPAVGSLVYSPASSVLYQGYLIGVPGAWHLGAYTPSVQACYVVVPGGCVLVPTIGVIQYTGTSVPGKY